jgi:hypothetical protein
MDGTIKFLTSFSKTVGKINPNLCLRMGFCIMIMQLPMHLYLLTCRPPLSRNHFPKYYILLAFHQHLCNHTHQYCILNSVSTLCGFCHKHHIRTVFHQCERVYEDLTYPLIILTCNRVWPVCIHPCITKL